MTCKIKMFFKSTIGKKIIVALTGLLMVAWLLGHMLGNLQIFAGRASSPSLTKINQYAKFLHDNAALLWITRIVMLKAIVMHVMATISLTRLNRAARPQDYLVKKNLVSSPASRMMIYGGLFIFIYVVYHLLHFTFHVAHGPLLNEKDLYQSIVNSFQVPSISLVYVLGQFALFFHLHHGIQSATRTLGLTNASIITVINKLGTALAVIICAGFSAVPISILMGWVS